MAEQLPRPLTSGALMPFAGEFEHMFNRFMRGWPFGWPDSLLNSHMPAMRSFDNAPRVEVKENGTAYNLSVELPGLDQNDVKVLVEDDVLTIAGEKRHEHRDDKTHYSELSYGSFHRSFSLPRDADQEHISANFAKGVLSLHIAKRANGHSGTRQIEIKPS